MDIQQHTIPFIDHAPLHILLLPARQRKLPEITSVEQHQHTGFEERFIMCAAGDQLSAHKFMGMTLTGVGPADLQTERERVARLRAALDTYATDLDAMIAFHSR